MFKLLVHINTYQQFNTPVTRSDDSLSNSSWSWLKRNGFWFLPDLLYISNSNVICDTNFKNSNYIFYLIIDINEKQNTTIMQNVVKYTNTNYK